MPLTINPKITFTGQEAREGILDPAFSRPNVTNIMDVRNNMKADEQIAFLGRVKKVSRLDPGCGLGRRNIQLPMEEKKWEPKKIKMWFDFCEDDLEDTFYVYLTANGVDRRDVSKVRQFWMRWVLETFTDASNEDFLRFAFLGDTAIQNVSGGGSLANTADVEDYNQLDGFWKQIFADVTGGLTPRYTIVKNTEASKAAQLDLAEDDAYQAYRGAWENADPRLRNASDLIYLVSGTLHRNRIFQKEQKSFFDISQVEARQDKAKPLNNDVYAGIPIWNMENIWDQFIFSDFDDGTVYDLPHRVILTTKKNLVAGFDSISDHNKFRTYYDEDTEAVNLKGGYKTDVKVMRPFMTSVAY